MSKEEFEADRCPFYAVTRCPEIVSEACLRRDPAPRDRHPELPMRAIMGMGNFCRHDYDNVAAAFVWRTVRRNLAGGS
jgi:uncharacterized protein with HEPN domain